MKRIGNLYDKIISIENLQLADQKARKGKKDQRGIKIHDLNRESNILMLHEMLKNKTYRTSEYTTFKIYEPTEREIFRLPFYPDRIVHHAVMNVLEPIFISVFTKDTYSSIKKRGIHAASNAVRKALKDVPGTKYCLKFDIRKFYPSIDHAILKLLLRKKFKDNDLLWLLDEIIDSADGVPIGNYLSQYLANFYMCYFDHWIKEIKLEKYCFRYADDVVILSECKKHLHELFLEIREYFEINLKLTIKSNYQVFLVASRGIDFVGYVSFHEYTLLRKGIKKNFARSVAKNKSRQSISSYIGWCKHANCKHLLKKLLNEKV